MHRLNPTEVADLARQAGFRHLESIHTDLSGFLSPGSLIGLRLDTLYALFRLDVGFPYPQPSSKLLGRFYFSIGQAF